jgi:hypothetical protein
VGEQRTERTENSAEDQGGEQAPARAVTLAASVGGPALFVGVKLSDSGCERAGFD